MVTATVVEMDVGRSTVTVGSGPDEKTAVVGSGPGEKTAVVGDDCTACMHAQDGPDTDTVGTVGQSTAGTGAVESRPDTGVAGRSPGPASQGSRSEGRTRPGSEGKRDEVMTVVVARCRAQG